MWAVFPDVCPDRFTWTSAQTSRSLRFLLRISAPAALEAPLLAAIASKPVTVKQLAAELSFKWPENAGGQSILCEALGIRLAGKPWAALQIMVLEGSGGAQLRLKPRARASVGTPTSKRNRSIGKRRLVFSRGRIRFQIFRAQKFGGGVFAQKSTMARDLQQHRQANKRGSGPGQRRMRKLRH